MSNYPGAPMGAPPSGSANGTLILVLGILSIVCLPILGPVAWIMGNNAINSGGVDPSQAGLVNAGRICGIIGTVLFVLGIVYVVFFGGLAALTHHNITTNPTP